MEDSSFRLDPRAALAIGALALVIFAIIFIELCGKEDVDPEVQVDEQQPGVATATLGPTFTPGPSPTVGPTVPTEEATQQPGGQDRDAQRVSDLQTLQGILDDYEAENGGFPDNEGNVQTLCVFTEFDIGCELLEVADPLPEDPLGEPSLNGYWYASNGSTYTLYAQRESEAFPACAEETPEFLQDFETLICVTGP